MIINLKPYPCIYSIYFSLGVVSVGKYIYAIGGYDGKEQLNSVERYNIRENCWVKVASMKHRRSALTVAVYDKKIYAIGESVSSCLTFVLVNVLKDIPTSLLLWKIVNLSTVTSRESTHIVRYLMIERNKQEVANIPLIFTFFLIY